MWPDRPLRGVGGIDHRRELWKPTPVILRVVHTDPGPMPTLDDIGAGQNQLFGHFA